MPGFFAGSPLEQPLTCERCARTHAACACPRARDGKVLDPNDQPVRIRRERRAGKMVTVISGLTPRSDRTDDLPAMLKALKSRLGAGGSIHNNQLELQGDHRDTLVQHFKALGYPAIPAGG